MTTLDEIVWDAVLVVLLITLVYTLPLTILGVIFARRRGGSLRGQLTAEAGPPATLPGCWSVFVIIPCLNEERVIATTVRCLLDSQPGVRVIVVDDGSDDATAELAAAAEHVSIVRRTLPEARKGKGAALNAGLCSVRRRVEEEGLDRTRVLVCVLDADGRLTPGAAAQVTRLFEDPTVGGAQLAVRIRGRRHWALRFQDIEFWGLSALGQFGRVATGSVSIGGNGQFTRLAALDSAGQDPWSHSLTEDLDLGISLAVHGWTVTSTAAGFVSQQGLTCPRRLLRQRTRWYQGHMSSITRLPELWASSVCPAAARLELTGYLLIPYITTLPWSLLQQYLLLRLLQRAAEFDPTAADSMWMGIATAIVWCLLSFVANLVWAVLYWRRTNDLPLWKAAGYCVALALWSYTGFIACWRAIWRIATGRRGWVKTERAQEA
ncbi:glycosyltransferase [Streptomyces syringium]|uniref:glycosyltransferase n=1 Tax=Streptomyces syringium TaxID=76729 RepID=UPI003435845D